MENLFSDASEFAIGSVLCQIQDQEEKIIAYASRKLSNTEKRYGITKKRNVSCCKFHNTFQTLLVGECILKLNVIIKL